MPFPRDPVPPTKMEEYKRAIDITGANVQMMGTLIAANAVRLMRDVIKPTGTAKIWGVKSSISCPAQPGMDAQQVPLGVLRIGDIYWAPVNAELYNEIGTHLRAASPASRTIVVALGYGSGGYIRSDNAMSHGAILAGPAGRPSCNPVEGQIIAKELELIGQAGN